MDVVISGYDRMCLIISRVTVYFEKVSKATRETKLHLFWSSTLYLHFSRLIILSMSKQAIDVLKSGFCSLSINGGN